MSDLIDGHVAHIRAAGYSEVTISDRAEVLRRVDRELPCGLESATTPELAEWLSHPGWSPQTRATYYGHIRAFYRWACDTRHSEYLSYDPSAGLTRPKIPQRAPRPVSDDELHRALTGLDERYRLYVLLAYHAGLRCCEIVRLHREHITDRDLLIVRGKGGYRDMLPTHPEIWAAVKGLPPGPVCHITRAANLSRAAGCQFEHLGLKGVTMHRFRHAFATDLLRNGVNIRIVQELLRHRSLASTQVYCQVTDEERRRAVCTLLAVA